MPYKIALGGYGAVGQAFERHLSNSDLRNWFQISQIIVFDPLKNRPPTQAEFVYSLDNLDTDISLVVDALGGVSASFELISYAAEGRKLAISCNKELWSQKADTLCNKFLYAEVPALLGGLVAHGEPFEDFGAEVNSLTLAGYRDADVYSFRGGGPEETARAMLNDLQIAKNALLKKSIKNILFEIGKEVKIHRVNSDNFIIDIDYEKYVKEIMKLLES